MGTAPVRDKGTATMGWSSQALLRAPRTGSPAGPSRGHGQGSGTGDGGRSSETRVSSLGSRPFLAPWPGPLCLQLPRLRIYISSPSSFKLLEQVPFLLGGETRIYLVLFLLEAALEKGLVPGVSGPMTGDGGDAAAPPALPSLLWVVWGCVSPGGSPPLPGLPCLRLRRSLGGGGPECVGNLRVWTPFQAGSPWPVSSWTRGLRPPVLMTSGLWAPSRAGAEVVRLWPGGHA